MKEEPQKLEESLTISKKMKIKFSTLKIRCDQVTIKKINEGNMNIFLPSFTQIELPGIGLLTPSQGSQFKCTGLTIKKKDLTGVKFVLPAHTSIEIPEIGLITPPGECTIEFLE